MDRSTNRPKLREKWLIGTHIMRLKVQMDFKMLYITYLTDYEVILSLNHNLVSSKKL